MEEVDWSEVYKGFWAMVGMASVNAPEGTDLNVVGENINKLLEEKLKEQWQS